MGVARFDPIPALAASQRQLVTRRQLLAHRVSKDTTASLIRREQLRRVGRGVFLLPAGEWDYPTAVLAAILGGKNEAWGARETALGLHGLTRTSVGPAGPAPKISLVTKTSGRRRAHSLTLYRTRVLPEHHTVVVDEVPVTSVARTLADLAGSTGPKMLRRWAAHALRERKVTLGALWIAASDLRPGRPGRGVFGAMAAGLESEVRAPGISELEFQARRLLAMARLTPDTWECQVSASDSGWIGRVDALFRQAHLIVEFDGGTFHDYAADARRDRALLRQGFVVRRFTWLDITQRSDVVVAELRATLAGRMLDPHAASS